VEKIVIGMDIGGTNIRIAMQRQGQGTENFRKVARETVLNGDRPIEALAAFIETYIGRYCGGRRPQAVVIGFPAAMDAKRRTVLQAPNIPGLDGLPAADLLEEKLGLPVYLEKDVNLLFYSDMADLQLPESGIGIGVYVGTGIGNAIFLDGAPLPGRHGVSGELGHIPRAGGKERCGCGNFGCSECYGSGWHLVELRDRFFPETSVSEIFTRHGYAPEIAGFIDNIAVTIATEITILDPDYIVLGGGVLNAEGFPMEALKQAIVRHTRKPFPAEALNFYQSKDAVENGVRGAIMLGWKKIDQKAAG
jgi:allose kinase